MLQNTREGPNPPRVVPLVAGERVCPLVDAGSWPRLPVPDVVALLAHVLPLMRLARSRIARSVINTRSADRPFRRGTKTRPATSWEGT